MTDDFEELLRKYQPLAPPPSLRTRILRSASVRRRTWPWAAAAAALLVASTALQAARARLFEAWPDVRADHRNVTIEMLTEAYGGGEIARAQAELAVARDEVAQESTPVGTSGSAR